MSYQLILRDRRDSAFRVVLVSGEERRSYPEMRDLLTGLERKLPARLSARTRYFAVEPTPAGA